MSETSKLLKDVNAEDVFPFFGGVVNLKGPHEANPSANHERTDARHPLAHRAATGAAGTSNGDAASPAKDQHCIHFPGVPASAASASVPPLSPGGPPSPHTGRLHAPPRRRILPRHPYVHLP
ncbi:hypothetical protein GUJ93_ZPchr0013g37549 [Zizania palustris]|uniref:Uncharacterized protein n=1 Tax=Zizania palustris TaxID=103762 RepID=A0A8J5WW94_ZIZPA|nr:hypothetical protein GUJ93_ZPchr0013g37549 [Zizania palustris]